MIPYRAYQTYISNAGCRMFTLYITVNNQHVYHVTKQLSNCKKNHTQVVKQPHFSVELIVYLRDTNALLPDLVRY